MMCGFLGIISKNNINNELFQKANNHITCRGPDEKIHLNSLEEKKFSIHGFNFSFIFNRLSIQDLSPTGKQPMYSKEFNSLIMFNGEVFNHIELRRELESEGFNFYSNFSDTEVLLNGLSKYGKSYLKKINGQFSIFFINFDTNDMFFTRDRLGQKPLYYTESKKELLFGSNFKSLITYKSGIDLDKSSMADFLSYGVIPSPNTIDKNTYKLKPAEILEYTINEDEIRFKNKEEYWQINNLIHENRFDTSLFLKTLDSSIDLRTNADVPISNLLSGGIDSTFISKKIKELGKKFTSYSVFFSSKYNEKPWIEDVVDKYALTHESLYFNKLEFKSIDEKVINSFDEPYFDPSNMPSYLIYEKVSKEYKVTVTGDGGDELLNGYKRLHASLKPPKYMGRIFENLYKIYPSIFGTGNIFKSRSRDVLDRYESFLNDEKFKKLIFPNYQNNFNIKEQYIKNGNLKKSIMALDYKLFLSEMMLLKVDRTSMAHGIEARSPFLDYRLIEQVLGSKINNERFFNKKLIKNILSEDFNHEFLNRKKMGFVFDLKKYVYSRDIEFFKIIKDSELSSHLNLTSLRFFKIIRTRINSHRIYKLYILASYLNMIKELSNEN
jgi:asparagine synthase (glutamine-hydrolysing)